MALGGCSNDDIEYRTPESIYTETLIHTEVAAEDNHCEYNFQWTIGKPYRVIHERKEGYSAQGATSSNLTGYRYREPVDIYAYYTYIYYVNGIEVTADKDQGFYHSTLPGDIYGTIKKGDVITVIEIKDAFE